ncbi:unnamed protein product [Cylindrotheca closterium]|uniref:Uncharacterized protein n=1 Tax=Cylindrotheca closterium TaxID=2856 RepID=A0AAD2CUG7_9STRA|nr:unnamed protein product [Cylindrotheca closterium]
MIQYQHPKLLSTQESLSDSTTSTISTKQFKPTHRSKKRRRVLSFNRNVLVYEDDSHSQAERNQMHYTREEIQSFAGATLQCIDSIRRLESQSSQTNSSPIMVTGLEGFLHPEHKKKHRLQGVLAVLMEQERQYKEQGLFTPVDFDSMSHSYHMASQESHEEAHQRALAQHKVVSMAA